MDREQIERLKINSDCSYTYMRKLKKECLLGKTMIDEKIQNSEGIEEVNRLFDQVYTKGFKGLLWSSLFLLIGLFVLYFVRHITDSRRVTYLNYIRNANSFKERMLITNMESTDT